MANVVVPEAGEANVRGVPNALNADGDYSYHHCATLKITANPALPIATNWPGQSAQR